MGTQILHKLPIIDFTKENLKPGTSSWLETCKDVTDALEDYGCFIAVCDNVSIELHNEIFVALQDLFDLPTQTKVQNKSNIPLYGYVGQIPLVPLYESMGIGYANTQEGVQNFTNLMWPLGNDHFGKTMLTFAKLIAELEQTVVRMVFGSYGLEKYYDSHVRSATYLSRVMKYRAPEKNETNMGFVAHTDKSFMTILHQNQINGLEIKAKDGQWFSVELFPSSFVVMAGDAAMAWSNNRIHSPLHRVTMNEKKTRYSTAQFSFMEGMIQTAEELVDEEHPLQFKPFDHLEYLKFFSMEENRRLESALRTYCGV